LVKQRLSNDEGATDFPVAQSETAMKMKTLVIGGLVTIAAFAGGWALASRGLTVRAASDRLSCVAWGRMAWARE
jgi:hypothetical protein